MSEDIRRGGRIAPCNQPASSHKHTTIHDGKDHGRAWALNGVPRSSDIITVSPSLIPVLFHRKWTGKVQVADIDQVARDATRYARNGYPELKILSPEALVQEAIPSFIREHGSRNLGLVDLDFCFDLTRKLCGLVDDCMRPLRRSDFHGKVVLTLTGLGRSDDLVPTRGRRLPRERVMAFQSQLPPFIRVVDHYTYQSKWLNERYQKSPGSPMLMVEMRLR